MSRWRAVAVTVPGNTPVSVSEMKAHLRIEGTDEDAYLGALLSAGVRAIDGPDGYGVAMMAQSWTLTLDAFPAGGLRAREGAIRLPGWPVTGVTSITYDPAGGGSPATLDGAGWRLVAGGEPARIEPVEPWPATDARLGAVRVLYTLGRANAADVDQGLLQALRLLVAHWHANREAVGPGGFAALPLGFEMLMAARARSFAG